MHILLSMFKSTFFYDCHLYGICLLVLLSNTQINFVCLSVLLSKTQMNFILNPTSKIHL
uniref:Uncharacterized protein n=1 Tax=Setaria italica TaxID=4555 RepID=K3Z153_SETIT